MHGLSHQTPNINCLLILFLLFGYGLCSTNLLFVLILHLPVLLPYFLVQVAQVKRVAESHAYSVHIKSY